MGWRGFDKKKKNTQIKKQKKSVWIWSFYDAKDIRIRTMVRRRLECSDPNIKGSCTRNTIPAPWWWWWWRRWCRNGVFFQLQRSGVRNPNPISRLIRTSNMIPTIPAKKLDSSLEQTPWSWWSKIRLASELFDLGKPGFINGEEGDDTPFYRFPIPLRSDSRCVSIAWIQV